MALAPPRLDDRGYADLRAELIRRIPVHSPEWTDYNATDPGIALVELFSFLGDNLLYRLNRAPEAAKLAFLQLLNVPPAPARAALAHVRIDLPKGAVDPITPTLSPILPRLQMAAGNLVFQATEEVTALPVQLAGYIKQPFADPLPPEATAQWINCCRTISAPCRHCPPTGRCRCRYRRAARCPRPRPPRRQPLWTAISGWRYWRRMPC